MTRNALVVRHEYVGPQFWVVDLPLAVLRGVIAAAALPGPTLRLLRRSVLRAVGDAARGRLGPPRPRSPRWIAVHNMAPVSAEPQNLMPKEFWEGEYYGDPELPQAPSDDFPYERALSAALREMAPVAPGETVIEVGCAPARWLLWYGRELGARVRAWSTATRARSCRVRTSPRPASRARSRRPTSSTTRSTFPPATWCSRSASSSTSTSSSAHFAAISTSRPRAGGWRIGVPNFRGLTAAMQRWADPEFLAAHNQAAMDPELFRGFARTAGWQLEAHRYIDSFDPWMIRVRRHGPGAILVPLMPIRRMRWTDRLNHPRLSSYLLMTFTR